ncbi:Ger(x)C family spore germination protein [Paenibacillus paeoniae]|uniref:Ger(x)C family spore germination protein n=1 Tax=Paenibacillus paeoniae TaxID=2292705 RepID=UPI001403C266|nr:Ger(x)C family spore germination protein [Paenibacillus paeoniae]
MKRLWLILILLLFLTTGCWDRRELNDQALIFAWGMDLNEDGSYHATAQFANPHSLGSSEESTGKASFSVSGDGNSVYEAAKDLQAKVSRAWFAGHRRVILIGEKLAKDGLANILDEYSRNPIVRLRTDILIVKGSSVEDILEVSYPLEQLPANAFFRIHEAADMNPDLTLLHFIMANASDENCPILPVVTVHANPDVGLQLWGTAIFNKDTKLVDYLPLKKGNLAQWIKGQLGSTIGTVKIPSEEGDIVVEINHLSANIQTLIVEKNIQVHVTLGGKGILRESNTHLDLSHSRNVVMVQEYLNEQTATEVKRVVKEIQKLGTDILGVGQSIHRQHPYQWKGLKEEWSQHFQQAKIEIEVKIDLEETGMTGPSLIQKKSEVNS